MASVHGPYKHRNRWRIILRHDGAQSAHSFATLQEAERFRAAAERQAAGVTLAFAIDAYELDMRARGLRENSWKTTTSRMRKMFERHLGKTPAEISTFVAQRIYQSMTATVAVDSHRNRLTEAKTFFSWCMARGWARRNPFESIKPVGRRKRGKPQLSIDEARRLVTLATERAALGDQPAIAILLCLYLGLRASEAVDRLVRDFDDDCSVLWIRGAKTAAGDRRLEIPDHLRPVVRQLVVGKHSREHALSFSRFVLFKELHKLCDAAKVQRVCVHSLRGLHATLATAAGSSAYAVSQALGHASEAVTKRHYTQQEAVEKAASTKVLRVLTGGPKSG